MSIIKIWQKTDKYSSIVEKLINDSKAVIINDENEASSDDLLLTIDESGAWLSLNNLILKGDFEKLIPRVRQGAISSEMLVKAARIKGKSDNLTALDATAGLGEDSLLLAAAGFSVKLYEYDPVIAILLMDTIERAGKNAVFTEIVSRMEVIVGDSIEAMKNAKVQYDVILLDPMFPERSKSALVGKKFQILQRLECPCCNELELMEAARNVRPKKLVVKRPVKGPNLAGLKPDYVIAGKAVRYDCFTFA